MSEYKPDRWVIVEITTPDIKIKKVLASWYGGYLGSDSWRMSSGISKITDAGDHFEILNESGSKYTCFKSCEGTSGYTASVFADMQEKLNGRASLEIIEVSKALD